VAKYDWDKLKVKYITGNYESLKTFAEQENINYGFLRKKACDWQEEKEHARNIKVTKIVTKTIEKVAEREADRNARFLSVSDMALEAIEDYLKFKKYKDHVIKYKYYDMEGKPKEEELTSVNLDVPDTRALANMINSLEKIQRGQRLALGLDKEDNSTNVIEESNNKMLTLADMINNPSKDRSMQDFESEGDTDENS
jgi:hypothetical protein